jgi:hypothetical protein
MFDTAPGLDAQECLTGILSAHNWYCNNSGAMNAHLEIDCIRLNAMQQQTVPPLSAFLSDEVVLASIRRLSQ